MGLALLALAPGADGQAPPVLNAPLARHTPSMGRAFTASRDGKWLFHCEGGTLVFIRADAADVNIDESSYRLADGAKRVGIGRHEVLAAKMILDPSSDPEPGPNVSGDVRNLLYIACGRGGLWVMEADVDAGVGNRAWRVDDSGDPTVGAQNSRRWCADVDLCRVNGVDYLLAVFAKKGNSVLRVYELDQVRAIADPGSGRYDQDFGSEIPPALQVVLSGNGAAPPNNAPENYTRPIAVALAVDQESSTGSGEYADIYVAMGPHGVVRTTLTAPSGSLTAVTTDGPVFGTGSAYDENPALAPEPEDARDGLYGNLVLESDWAFLFPRQVEERNEAPMFVDVAVFDGKDKNGRGVHQLFVAVDHLFWVVFDLQQTFGPRMPILHHEGDKWAFASPDGVREQPVVMPLSGGKREVSFGRSLAIVDTTEEGPLLVVTGSYLSIHRDSATVSLEAFGFDEHLEQGRTWTQIPSKARTYLYRIKRSYSDPDFNSISSFDEGGREVYVPPQQGTLSWSPDSYLAVFHSAFIFDSDPDGNPETTDISPAVALTRMPISSGTPQAFKRPLGSMRGRLAFNVAHSLVDPNLLLTSGNDANLPQDGFVVMGKNPSSGRIEVKIWDRGGDEDRRGSGRILMDGDMQWIDPAGPADPARPAVAQFVWTSGVHTVVDALGAKTRTAGFKLMHMVIPKGDAFGSEPDQDWHGYIRPPKDRFLQRSRVYYQAASMNRHFDAFLGPKESRLFGTWGNTPEGLVVLDGEFAVQRMKDHPGKVIDPTEWPNTRMRRLVTHPEFNNMPKGTQALENWWQGQGKDEDRRGLVQAWPSKLIELPGNRWVLAVPCGQIRANPAWDIYRGIGTAWLPTPGSIWDSGYSHGFVQFWEMKPENGGRYWPETATVGSVEGVSPLAKIIAPHADTNIHSLESVAMKHNGVDQVYLFCADFSGHLYVYSIADITNDNQAVNVAVDNRTQLVASWKSKQNFFDDQPSVIFDIAIDYRGTDTAMVYVTSPRVGVQVLEFTTQPSGTGSAHPTLVYKEIIQSSGWTTGVDIRANADGSWHLLVSENSGGLRVLGEAP